MISCSLPYFLAGSLKTGFKTAKLLQKFILSLAFISLILLGLPANGYAQETQLPFAQMAVEDGLSQSGVLAILQDSQGLMWFGTQDGLNKYDGYDFTIYKYDELDPNSLSDNFILSLYEDKSGTVWVGTESGGLNKFDRQAQTFTHYLHDPDNPQSLGDNKVLSIYEDKSGTLWVGTDQGGLNKLDRETGQFTRYTHNPDNSQSLTSNSVLSIYEDKLGTLWIGTTQGLNKFNRETKQFTHYTHNREQLNSLSSDIVLSIYEDKSDRLWLGTKDGGLNKLDRETEQFTSYTHNPANPHSLSSNTVNSIAEDGLGNLWLATSSWYGNSYGKALEKFDPETEQFSHYTHDSIEPNSLSDNIIGPILRDNSGILWIGTGFGGINKLNTKAHKFTNYQHNPVKPQSLVSNKISSIYEDSKDNLWIGTYNSGLDRLDHATGQFINYTHDSDNPNSISNNNIWSIYEDHLGTLWVGTGDGGLNKLDQKTGKFSHYTHNPNNPRSLSDNSIWSIYEDHQGILWIGTFNGGLNKFDRQTGKFTHYQHNRDNPNSISDNNVFSIYEDQSGTLWVGTWNNGLNKFDRETGKFTHYQHNPNNPNTLSYNRVMSMLEYPAGTLWLGTYGGGLNKFDIASETFTHYTVRDGLPHNSVVGILNDYAGNLWLSTGKGLSKFNPEKETFRNYDARDGLQGNEFDGIKAYAKGKDGKMFFGGLNGITSFYPEEIKDNPHIPPILITDFRIFDEPVKLDTAISQADELKLSYKDDFFSFKFAALDYANPGQNQYAYKLEGFDKDWIYSGERRYAAYTNLDPGTYTLRVKGSNNDGVWNEEGTSLKITITPPPWKTWWAYTLYIFAVIAAIYSYIKWKTAAQEKENKLLRENQRRLQQFLEAMPMGVGVVEPDGKPVYINQLGLEIHGIEETKEVPAEQMAKAYQAYIAGTKQLYPTADLPLVRALKGETTTADNIEIHRPDQKIIPVEVLGTPIYDEQGNIIYAIAAYQDITSRKRIETERQEYFEQLQAILNTIPGCVSWINSDGNYLGVNQHLAETFNLPAYSFIGQEVGFLENSYTFAQFVHDFLNSSKLTDSQIVDIEINDYSYNYLIAIQKYQEGNSAVLVGIDITEQKQNEESLNKALKQKELLLKEVNHRVRNNLQLICSILDLQCQLTKEEKTQGELRASHARIHSMALAHNTAYRGDSVEDVIVAEYVNSLILCLIQVYGISLGDIELRIDVNKEIRFDLNTAIYFGLLAGELISNALKHAFPTEKSGFIEIKLNLDSEVDNEQKFNLIIRDNGVGLPDSVNWQEPQTLGLQIVQALTTQLDGQLRLDGTQGTQFQLQFVYKNNKTEKQERISEAVR